jgi:DNA-directed RNA polymerase subunit alpha
MSDFNVVLPSKPKIVHEEGSQGVYEIDGLYPGYGHTLGNSLRRIILSSLPGAALTSVKITGVSHEFSTVDGIKEDVITIILNLKKIRIQLSTDEPQTISLKIKGIKEVTAADLTTSGQVTVLNPELILAHITDKNTELDIEATVEKGLGYVSREVLQKNKVDIGTISLDASFTPIRRVHYEVENMRVGDRTDFNRLKISIETDGTLTPKEALEKSIEIMISQLKAIVGFKEEKELPMHEFSPEKEKMEDQSADKEIDTEALKTRVETLNLSREP